MIPDPSRVHWRILEHRNSKRHKVLSRVAHLVPRGAEYADPVCGGKPGRVVSRFDEPKCSACQALSKLPEDLAEAVREIDN